jgi:hypothetical protein
MADVATSMGRSWPLQGGLPPTISDDADLLEIACDESGFSGSNLLESATPVITHASVDLSMDEAADLVATLRSDFHRSPEELKSAQFLRAPGSGEAMEWFLARLQGRAHVLVVDKEYFLATRVVDLFLTEPSYAAGTRLTAEHRPAALALYRAGQPADGDWTAFISAFVDLVRTKRRHQLDRRVLDRFFRARDDLAQAGIPDDAQDVLAALSRTRVRAVVTRLHDDDRTIPPPLEPLLPALAETVLHWSADGRQVLVIHDEQSALTPDRLRRLQDVLVGPGSSRSPLAGLVAVDSRDDARVQVADLLAGIARRTAHLDPGPLQALVSDTSLRA